MVMKQNFLDLYDLRQFLLRKEYRRIESRLVFESCLEREPTLFLFSLRNRMFTSHVQANQIEPLK